MNDPEAITLTVLFGVIAASLVGSLHCAGMCGGLVLFVVGADGTARKKLRLQVAYHSGRGVAYITLGAIAGIVGGMVNGVGDLAGLQRTAAILAGAIMIIFGLAAMLRVMGTSVPKFRVPKRARKLIEGAHRAAMALTPMRRALAVGLLTPLLPCGWLYIFVTAAAGSASPWAGGLVMGAFWLGTVPILATIGVGFEFLTGPLRARVPVISSAIIVALGVMTALGRVNIPMGDHSEMQMQSLETQIEHAATLDHAELPCCAAPEPEPETTPDSNPAAGP